MVNKVNCGGDTVRARKISSGALGLVVNMIVLWNTL
jgi:TnpA family transposase